MLLKRNNNSSSLSKNGRYLLPFLILHFILCSCENQPTEYVFEKYIEFDFNEIKTDGKVNFSKMFFKGKFRLDDTDVVIFQDYLSSQILYVNSKSKNVLKQFIIPRREGCKGASNLFVLSKDRFVYSDKHNNEIVLCSDKEIIKSFNPSLSHEVEKFMKVKSSANGFLVFNDELLFALDVPYGIDSVNTDSVFEFIPSFYKIPLLTNDTISVSSTEMKTVTSRKHKKDEYIYDMTPTAVTLNKNQLLLYQTTCDSVLVFNRNSKGGFEKVANVKVSGTNYPVEPIVYKKNLSYEILWEKVYDNVTLNDFIKSNGSNQYYRFIRPRNNDFELKEPEYKLLETLNQNFEVISELKVSKNYSRIVELGGVSFLVYKDIPGKKIRIEIIE